MKKCLLLLAAIAISGSSSAQDKKPAAVRFPTQSNTMFCSANLMLLVDPKDVDVASSRQHVHDGIHGRVGYFILDGLAFGIDVTVTNEHRNRPEVKRIHTKVGTFGRFYPGGARRRNGAARKLRYFAEAGAAFGWVDYKDKYEIVYNMLDLRIAAGVNYVITPRIAVELGLNGTMEFMDRRYGARYFYSPNAGLRIFFPGQ